MGATPDPGAEGDSLGDTGGSGDNAHGSTGFDSPMDPALSADAQAEGPALDPPRPAEPCDRDLDADNGAVRPDFGVVAQGARFSGDPLRQGPHRVLTTTHHVPNPDRTLNDVPLALYTPSDDGESPLSGRHGLVLIMPGYGKGFGITLAGTYPTYAFYSEHFASHGFVVVALNFVAGGLGLPLVTTENLGAHFLTAQEKNVDEVRAVLDWVLAESPARERIDADKIALAGHSQGGKIAFYVASADPRIDVVIGWDPQNAGGGTPCAGAPDTCNRLPIAPICPDPEDPASGDPGRMHELSAESLVFATRDANTMIDKHQWAEHFYRGAPSPAHLLLFESAAHDSFSDGENPVSHAAMRAQLALLLSRFRGMTGLDDYLPGGAKLHEGVSDLVQRSK
jgi:dienelactone hydrolase